MSKKCKDELEPDISLIIYLFINLGANALFRCAGDRHVRTCCNVPMPIPRIRYKRSPPLLPAVVRDMNRMATDYRLNFRLNQACEADISQLCPAMCAPGQPCGGVVLHCLTEKVDNITAADCREEVGCAGAVQL